MIVYNRNHFLELVNEEETGRVWIMVHSGSRNIGLQVATHYNEVAKLQLEKKGVDTQALRGLNYMPIESQEGQDYLRDMGWCQRYAFHNRRFMKETMLGIVEQVTGKPANMAEAVNIHHNYCACEECGDGRKLWVTRKGATSAKVGEMGIIPGSMGVGSFITRGKGNPLSWNSAAHGAGRRMSRKKARMEISQEDFEASMKGVVCDTDPGVKDEAPQAYKDLSEVMKNQESLTDIVYRLLPLVNVKGFEKGIPKNLRSRQEELAYLERERKDTLRGLQKVESKIDSKAFVKQAAARKLKAAQDKKEKLEERLAKIDARLEELSK
jgi:tRNA-splicing ligase RtcB (3'-phosphate/5'-hydroxy nucleic acid ligase)